MNGDDMNDACRIEAYIDAACALHQLPLAPEQRARLIQTFSLVTQIIAPVLEFELPPELEAAPVFRA